MAFMLGTFQPWFVEYNSAIRGYTPIVIDSVHLTIESTVFRP